jgi:hypothetical protein
LFKSIRKGNNLPNIILILYCNRVKFFAKYNGFW